VDTIANGTSITVIIGMMVSGTVAMNENDMNIKNITITMVTGKTATTIVTRTKTAAKYVRTTPNYGGQPSPDGTNAIFGLAGFWAGVPAVAPALAGRRNEEKMTLKVT
jgi:hypothetical protein